MVVANASSTAPCILVVCVWRSLIPGWCFRYQVGFRGAVNDAERVGSFTTLPDVVTRYKVICAACDKDKKRNRGPVIMWYACVWSPVSDCWWCTIALLLCCF